MTNLEKDYEFHKERTLYYKDLRDTTTNPELYVEYDTNCKYHLRKASKLSVQLQAKKRIYGE